MMLENPFLTCHLMLIGYLHRWGKTGAGVAAAWGGGGGGATRLLAANNMNILE